MLNLTFKGQRREYITIIRRKRSYWAPRNHRALKIPGLPGAHFIDTEIGVRVHPLQILIEADSPQDLLIKAEDVAEFLYSDVPASLVFDDEPLRSYYAIVDGALDAQELGTVGFVNVDFVCFDPYKYGETVAFPFVDGLAFLNNRGTTKASPIIEASVLEDITYLDVFNDEGYMRIGKPVELDATPFIKNQRVLTDKMETLTGWTTAGTLVDGGTVAGSFASTGGQFVVSSYGTGTGWHGPAVKKSVPQAPLTDFMVEFRIKFPTLGTKHAGRIELYLMDDQSQVIGKLSMKRTLGGSSGNHVEIRLGTNIQNKFLVSYAGGNGRAWNNFSGLLRLTRTGNVWEAYIAQVDPATSVQSVRHSARFVDTELLYMGNLSQIQVHAAQSGTIAVPALTIYDLRVDKINTPPTGDSPYVIAKAGDIIKFDHKRSELTINGEDVKQLKDFGASFFKLDPGDNVIMIDPQSKIDATLTIQEVYL